MSGLPVREVIVSPSQFQRTLEMVQHCENLGMVPDEISRRVLLNVCNIDVGHTPTPTEYRFVVDWAKP